MFALLVAESDLVSRLKSVEHNVLIALGRDLKVVRHTHRTVRLAKYT